MLCRKIIVSTLCAVLSISAVFAQVGTSSITGRTTDTSGAVIARVAVTIVQPATNFQFAGVTNEDGIYRVPSLAPGLYRITFEAPGFKRTVRDNVDLRTGDTLAVDAVLQIGNVTESVEVTATTPLLETETSATGTVVEGDVLHKLPMYQRYVVLTLTLTPGMTMGGYAGGGDLGAYHVAGQRAGAIGIFEDGVNGNDQMGGTGAIKPIQNATEEVKVLTTTLPAEYGHSAGGVVQVVKKSGTNQFHGLASDYGRVRRMQHRLFFDRYRTSDSQPGAPTGVGTFFMLPEANASGPVFIPKLYDGRNKTFFFFAYQKLIEKKTAQVIATTPSAAMRGGDFTFGGAGNPIYDPASTRQVNGAWVRDPFPGNVIPQNRFDPVARKILALNPWVAPNVPGSLTSGGPNSNLIANENARVYFEDFSLRMDHQFNQNFKIYGSWTYNHQSGFNRPINIQVKDFDGSQGTENPFTQKNLSFGATNVLNPTTVNDVRAGYLRRRNDGFSYSADKNWAQTLGIPGVSGALMPQFGGGDRYSAEGIYGLTGNGNNRLINETLSFRDDLTKIHGTHAFKMGYEWLRFRLNSTVTNRPSGSFFFDGMTANLQPTNAATVPNTGNTFAGFLLGSVRQAQFDAELTSWLPRSSINSFYFQDDWKVTPTLTLNLGVRYSNESPFNTKYALMSNFDPTAADTVVAGAKGAITHPTSGLNKRDNNNFQPRIGAAWHPLDRVVFRGGFSLNTVDVKFPAQRGQFDEFVALNNQERNPGDPRPLFQISQGPAAIAFPTRPNSTSGYVGTNYGSRNVEWWDPNLRNPYVLNWNLSTQYQLSQSYVLDVVYQGSAGVGLLERWEYNTFPIDFAKNDPALRNQVFAAAQNYRPFPNYGSVKLRSNFGHSTYHSGTAKIEKRLSKGLMYSAFYTFSKAIDSQDNDNDGSGVAPLQNRGLEKGRAGYDRNHRFNFYSTYELPIGRGKKFLNKGGIWNQIFGGNEVAWIQMIESGNPYSFDFANSPNNYFPTFAGNRRPDLVSQPSLLPNWGNVGGDRFTQANRNPIIDINNFAYPAAFTPGNSGRNIMTGTRLLWTQLSAQKNWVYRERFKVQLRWDFQNPFHNYNFDKPSLQVDFRNPKLFGKLLADQRTASVGGQSLQNLTLQLSW